MKLWPFGRKSVLTPEPAPRSRAMRRAAPRRPDPLVSALENRLASALGGPERAYDAAEVTRITSDWAVSYSSANEELRRALPVLRAAARHHERNSDLFRRYLSLMESNVIHDGFELQCTPRWPDGKVDSAAARRITEAWWAWASQPVTLDGRLTFPDVERLVLRTLARDGEVFVRFHVRGGQLRLEIIESDHVPVEIHRSYGSAVLGIELDADRRPVGYWIEPEHPGDTLIPRGSASRRAEFVPAKDVLHPFRSERPGQIRGVPWGSAVFDKLLMLQGYQIAELAAARMDAARPAAVEMAADGLGAQYRGDSGTQDDPEVNLEPGGITILPQGATMNWSPGNHPSGTFAPFVSEIKRDIAAGLQVSYHALNSDLSGANYSSLKHGRADEVRAYRVVQDLLAYRFHSPVFRRWLELYLLDSANPFPVSKFDKFAAHEWRKPAFEPVDDEKEASAIGAMLELGLTSKQDEAAKRGQDYAELCERRKADAECEKKNGLTPLEPEPAAPAPVKGAAPKPAKEPPPEKAQ